MKRKTSLMSTCILVMAAISFASTQARALQDAAPAGEAAPQAAPEGESLKIEIIAIQGMVQVRPGDDQPWQRATVGMELQPGWDIRTSLRAAVQFTIDGNHTVTVDRLGDVRVLEAIRKDGKVKTDVGMRYGRTEYKVEVDAEEHESSIHTPSATLAIRGSETAVEDTQLGCQVLVRESNLAFVTGRGGGNLPPIFLVKGEVDVDNQTQKKQGPGQNAENKSSVDGGSEFGKTGTERTLRSRLSSNVNQGQQSGAAGRQYIAQNSSPLPRDRFFLTYNFFNNGGPGVPGSPNNPGNPGTPGTPNTPNNPNTPTIASGSLVAFLEFSPEFGNLGLLLNLPDGNQIATNSLLGPTSVSSPVQGFASGNAIIFSNGVQAGPYSASVRFVPGTNGSSVPFNLRVVQFGANASNGVLVSQFSGTVNSPSTSVGTTFNVGN